jgi:hypothetical protein
MFGSFDIYLENDYHRVMIKVRMIDTGDIKELERNQAHALIDSKKAELLPPEPPKKERREYSDRQFRSTASSRFKTK